MNAKKFIEENKVLIAIWGVWMLINFAMWGSADKYSSKHFWYPGGFYDFNEIWDLSETIVYGVGPLAIYILFKILEEDAKLKK